MFVLFKNNLKNNHKTLKKTLKEFFLVNNSIQLKNKDYDTNNKKKT